MEEGKMNIYMLQDVKTGKYYKRHHGFVMKEFASVWTSKNGPASAKGSSRGARAEDTIIRTFKLEPCDE